VPNQRKWLPHQSDSTRPNKLQQSLYALISVYIGGRGRGGAVRSRDQLNVWMLTTQTQ